MKTDLFIFAGEASGDLHGKHLLECLNKEIKVSGVGGPKMRSLPFECLMPTEEFQVMGFSDVFKSLPKLIRQFYQIRNMILETNPKMVLFIDYPGFNLRMAKSLRKKGFKNKLVHYIAPTVWAWGKKRAESMAKTLDLLLTIFPFENSYFPHLATQYVGNPLISQINNHRYHEGWKKEFSLPDRFLALFPGSRPGDIERNLPLQLQAAKKLHNLFPSFAISCAHPNLKDPICKLAASYKNFQLIPDTYTYDLMKDASAAISKSGTSTLELALHGCPTVVTYQLSRLNYFIAKHLYRIRLPHFCIANILLNETLFPEVIGLHLDSSHIAEKVKRMINPQEYLYTKNAAIRLKQLLTEENASMNASKAIEKLL